jgi:hypothetical protein
MKNTREFIDQVVEAVRDAAEGRAPKEVGFGSPHSTAMHLGFIEECVITKPCKACGTPKHDWSYFKPTLAGQAYLALAQGIEAATAAETPKSGSVHESPVAKPCAQ